MGRRPVVGISGGNPLIRAADDLVDRIAGRALDLFDIDVPDLPRWGE